MTLRRAVYGSGAVTAFIAALLIALQTGLPERARYTGRITNGQVIAPELGALAPPFDLYNPEGDLIRLDDLRGQAVVVNFWATWCEPCKVEMPALQAVYDAYRENGLRMIAVNLGETRDTVNTWVKQMGLTFDILLDPSQQMAAQYQLRGQPATFVIGRDGVIKHVFYGATSEAALRGAIAPLLAT